MFVVVSKSIMCKKKPAEAEAEKVVYYVYYYYTYSFIIHFVFVDWMDVLCA